MSTYYVILRVALAEDIRQGWRMRLRQDSDEFNADAVLEHVKVAIIGGMHCRRLSICIVWFFTHAMITSLRFKATRNQHSSHDIPYSAPGLFVYSYVSTYFIYLSYINS